MAIVGIFRDAQDPHVPVIVILRGAQNPHRRRERPRPYVERAS
jgi:hypothetical protein